MNALPPAPSDLRKPPDTGRATAPGRFWLWLGAVAFLVFVVYGSLVPLRFQVLPWEQALERFRTMPYLALGIGSRADWVSNILLFIPLCFLWTGVLWPRRRAAWRFVVAGIVLAAAVALSVAIEFVQIYFPPRTVSLNDIVAEAAGAVVGIGLWWALGHRVTNWLQGLPLARDTANVAQRLLAVYLLALFGYNLLPLDLTISPVEIYHKWREGKLIWLPFTTHYADAAQRAYDLVTDSAIWVPPAALWVLAGRKTRMQAWASAVTAALLLEGLQLFVYSRVSDSTDVFTAALGAAVGVALVRPRMAMATERHREPGPGALRWAIAAVVWTAVLSAVFWYPFDFNVDRNLLRERVAGLDRVPFETYYFGTEFRAITEVLRKSLFFAPLGFLLFRVGRDLPSAWPRAAVHVAMLVLIAVVATVIESVQLLLPGKVADFTDATLEFLGGLVAYVASLYVVGASARGPTVVDSAASNNGASPARPQRAARPRGLTEPTMSTLSLLGGVSVLTLVITFLGVPLLPQVPYNVRELLAPPGAPWTAAVVAVAALLVFGMPTLIAVMAALHQTRVPAARTLAMLFGAPGIAAAVLFLGGPTESVRDLVGNASYRWWPWGETWLRLAVLLLGVVWSMALGCALQGLPLAKGDRGGAVAHLMLHGLWVVPLWHIVVVVMATTDNLTELMSGGGTWLSSVCLLAYTALLGAASASLLSGLAMRSRRALAGSLLVTAISLVLGYFLIWIATETVVIKYGQVFSALQFLLSTDRSALAEGHELLLRFAVAHLLALVVLACATAAVLSLTARFAAGLRPHAQQRNGARAGI